MKLPKLFTFGGALALVAGLGGVVTSLAMQGAARHGGEVAKFACVFAVLGLFSFLIGLEMWNEADKHAEARRWSSGG